MKLRDILKLIPIIDLIKKLLGKADSSDIERALTIYQRVRSAEARLKAAEVGEIVMPDPIRGLKLFGARFTVMLSLKKEE